MVRARSSLGGRRLLLGRSWVASMRRVVGIDRCHEPLLGELGTGVQLNRRVLPFGNMSATSLERLLAMLAPVNGCPVGCIHSPDTLARSQVEYVLGILSNGRPEERIVSF